MASGRPEAPEIPFDQLDQDALKVVNRLLQHGYEAYFVGGCVRDLLLGRRPKDFDIATSALPNEVRNVFRNCRLIGRRFRLAHVYFKGGKIVEVSTFRANPTEVDAVQALVDEEAQAHELAAHSELAEGAPPPPNGELPPEEKDEKADDLLITQDNVFGTAEQDARRRDFTVNGLFYDVASGKVIDFVKGRRDLDLRRIRTIGDPEVRMREDPVRLLRAIRFASKLGLDLESRTYAAMEGAVEDLPRCSAPRLLEETFRLLRGGVAAPSLRLVSALDALKILLPPIDAFLRERGPEGEKSFYAHVEALDRKVTAAETPPEDAILLAALLLPLSRATPLEETQTDEGPRASVGQVIEDLLNELVRNARLPRRIAERCRMILLSQRTLSGERRRRSGLGSFRRHPLFNESLFVFEIGVEATGEYKEQLEAWRAGGVPTLPTGAPAPEGRKRRRRRRRGPRREGEAGAAAAGSAEGGDDSARSGSDDTGGADRHDEGEDDGADAAEDNGGDDASPEDE